MLNSTFPLTLLMKPMFFVCVKPISSAPLCFCSTCALSHFAVICNIR